MKIALIDSIVETETLRATQIDQVAITKEAKMGRQEDPLPSHGTLCAKILDAYVGEQAIGQGKQAKRRCSAAFAIESCAMEAHVKSTVEYCFASGRWPPPSGRCSPLQRPPLSADCKLT